MAEKTEAKPGVQLKGQVQKAFGGGEGPPVEDILGDLKTSEVFSTEYGPVVEDLDDVAKKIALVKTFKFLATQKVLNDPEGTKKKRAGILNGYASYAEKKGVQWRQVNTDFKSRGMEVWEAELEACSNKQLSWPDYYVKHGVGTLHSYGQDEQGVDGGNCNWEAAFDAPSAYMLVHLHHYPELSPQDAFDRLHEELDNHALEALGELKPAICVDIGCAVGTSTFSTRKSLDKAGHASAMLTGVDLSAHFVSVAKYRAESGDMQGFPPDKLAFLHGDGLHLAPLGFADASVQLVMASEVTHEMPQHVSKMLLREVVRVLQPGGVFAYMDLNPHQILRDNPAHNLLQRIAMSNEPYFDEYLELQLEQEMEAAGLEVVNVNWPNHDKYATGIDCSLRIVIARKR